MSTPIYPLLRDLGLQEYEPVWRQMQEFNRTRDEHTRDEIWFLEHQPVFTLGMNAAAEHVLAPQEIPVINIDRGGQVTYHGPGQLVAYPLIDLKRMHLGVRDLVTALERSIIETLGGYDISAAARPDAPGVYVRDAKVASIGLRVKRNCSYHGLAFNVKMDLSPFQRINPCGFKDMEVTQLSDLGGPEQLATVRDDLALRLIMNLGYNAPPEIQYQTDPIIMERAS
ncbi:MAG: lipoyl(octanoyl) transferase LipB [Gammaproteobacteria bacterium]|nr:lipoyl(octanoyl) transferase LipB [Gammaproteobacteria bacterium]MDH3767632.1 lipoyl(octanoyl) transferase LipB [Gammaproteobacteria bacterium]